MRRPYGSFLFFRYFGRKGNAKTIKDIYLISYDFIFINGCRNSLGRKISGQVLRYSVPLYQSHHQIRFGYFSELSGFSCGLEVLQKGGNAVDAAIAVASTMNVVYPQMTTLGGDNFWLIYNAKTKEVKALNASGRAGELATIDFYKKKGFERIPSRGYLAANTVPGTVSGWDAAHKYAHANMSNSGLPWKALFDSAILYSQDGFPVTPSLHAGRRSMSIRQIPSSVIFNGFPGSGRLI